MCVSRLQLFIKQQLPADGHHVPSAARGHWAERRGHSGHQAASNPAGGAETAHTAVWEMSNNKSTTTTTTTTNTQTNKQTHRTLYFYLFLSAGRQSQTRGASLPNIKLINFDYHPAHSVIQHVRHTPPFVNHMQSTNNSLEDLKSRSTVSDSPRTRRCVKQQSTSWTGVRERRKIFYEQKSYKKNKKRIF